ncbi:MAG: Lrp/AsnC family transcriptional regulator [Promethearchaeota archaeon]
MFNKKLNVDEIDKMIISLLQENPEMTHAEISKIVHKSQPAVGARIIKLKRKHLLETQIGVNFKKVDIRLAKIEMLVKNVSNFLRKIEQCPFVLHGFKMSGNMNICLLIAAPDLKTIDKMVDLCFRKDKDILSVNVDYIISSVKDLILPINFDIEHFDEFGCGTKCAVTNGELDKLKKLIKETKEKALMDELNKSGRYSHLVSTNQSHDEKKKNEKK